MAPPLSGAQDARPTFDKELGAALLAAHHAPVSRVVRQRALADGQRALGADGLEDVPGRGRGVGRRAMDAPPGLWAPPQTAVGTPVPTPQAFQEPYLLWSRRGHWSVPMEGARPRENEQGIEPGRNRKVGS